jgi:hypothetical protein
VPVPFFNGLLGEADISPLNGILRITDKVCEKGIIKRTRLFDPNYRAFSPLSVTKDIGHANHDDNSLDVGGFGSRCSFGLLQQWWV